MTGRENVDLGRSTRSQFPLDVHSSRDHLSRGAASCTKNDNVEIGVPQLNGADIISFLEPDSLPGIGSQEGTKDPSQSPNVGLHGTFLEGLLPKEFEMTIASASTKPSLQEATDQCLDSMLEHAPEMACGLAPEITGGQKVQCNLKRKQAGNQQSKRSRKATRQFQYRLRKKQREKKLQEEIELAKEAIESLKTENMELKSKQDSLTATLKRREESFHVLKGRTQREYMDCKLDEGAENNIQTFLAKMDPNVYPLYADVLSSFQHAQKDVPVSTMLDMFSNILETVPSNSMYQRFHRQLETLINKYDECNGDDAKQEVLETEMKVLFSKRILVVDEMAEKEPNIIVSLVTDGWIGDLLHQSSLPGSSMKASQVSILAIVRQLKLTSSQIASLYSHWKIFRSFCNESDQALWLCLTRSCGRQEVDGTAKCTSESLVDTLVDVLESQGVHGLMHYTNRMYTLCQKIDAVLKNRVVMALGLAQNIYAVFTPLQKARLCMSQQAAPWCIHVPLMLADLSLDTGLHV
ncbi:hypothetical protein PSENEW3n2_00003897 [Picochlorum sp. SENEW3]|nr:hypothetical protein PSENEW3n2_00003897 [Picochlorum sp. SENEW3]WPT18597.1 hypothetical protein PSENEW3_00003897 [Picochlorum sp. SENEW3]